MATKKAPLRIDISPNQLAEIERHAYSDLDNEVGGMLIGSVSGDKTKIVGFIPARKAAADQISLTFTHEVWADILTEAAKSFPKDNIVGWYHTHPGHGLFLSQYDEFIQNNFFQEAGQVALVIDPIAGNLAWFTKRGKAITKFGDAKTVTGPRERPLAKAQRQGGVSVLNTVIIAAVVAVITGLVTWGTLMIVRPPQDGLINTLGQQNAMLSQTITTMATMPTLIYTMVEGDTFDSVVQHFYAGYTGPDDPHAMVLEANGLDNADGLTVGSQIKLPNVPNVTVWDLQNVIVPVETPEPAPSSEPSSPSTTNAPAEPSATPTPTSPIPGLG